MARISRLFGRKSESSEITDQEKTVKPPESNIPAEDKSPTEAEELFGLKFISDSGEEHVFTSLPISIGRAEDNDLVLRHETVSARHALVYYDERARSICILDQDSLNGVTIESLPTRKNLLADGVKIALGAVGLTFRDTGYLHKSD